MSVSGTLTPAAPSCDSGTVLYEKSVAHVSGTFEGVIYLQAAPVGTTDWVGIEAFSEPECMALNTPDTTMLFRFTSDLSSGSANVYLGA